MANPQKTKPKTSGMKPSVKANTKGLMATANSKLMAMKKKLKSK